MHGALGSVPSPKSLDMVVHTCNPGTWGWWQENQKLRAVLNYIVNLSLVWLVSIKYIGPSGRKLGH